MTRRSGMVTMRGSYPRAGCSIQPAAIKSAPVSPRSAVWAGVGCESPRGYGSGLTLKVVGSIPTSGAPNIEAWGASSEDDEGLTWADFALFARSLRIASDYERSMRQVERLVGKP